MFTLHRKRLARFGFALLVSLVSLCMTARQTLAAAGPATGLAAWWSFDKVKGRLTPDGSAYGNDAVLSRCMWVKGVRGRAFQFDGKTTCVRCMGTGSLTQASAITIEAWVKPDAARSGGYPTIVRQDGSYALRFGGDRLALLLWFGGKPVYLHSVKTDWAAGQWYHLAATYDRAQMRLFIDGAADADLAPSQSVAWSTSVMPCSIGGGGGGGFFRGVIDEVRVYTRALSPDEIKASHAKGRESIRAQKDIVIKPEETGPKPVVFRKPRRSIAMTEKGFMWIDAEDFTDYGGWLLDTQFVHLMGSAYLIAPGIGKPVKDAMVDVDIPAPGKYRLWVRARNWIKDYAPGKFSVSIAGVRSKQVFGAADTEDWVWEGGGDFDLGKGRVQIALHDLTGYYGRCDALILTTDMRYTPPQKLAEIQRERSRLTGLSLEPKLAGEFDVIVVGAGSAGCPAALAAARMGAKTALIQNRPVLGGNASIELGVGINGAASCHPNARESGIVEEIGRIKARFGYRGWGQAFREAADKEPNLTVFLNRHVFAADMRSKSNITAVKAVDTLTNEITVYRGKMFIDCTGDGWVGYYAGAKYRRGRESRDEFNESLAPEKPDKITMSGCIMAQCCGYRAQDTGKPVKYEPPPWAPKFPPAEEFGRNPRGIGGSWWLEHPGDIDDIWHAEQARDELIRITFGYWDYVKNVSPMREKADSYALTLVPIVDAKRESRRLVGDYMLNQNDVQNAVLFPDRISHGGWPIDVHHPRGIYSGKEGPFDCNPGVPVYSVPFRSLYSVNIENLLFAGRCMSVTHVALGTVRVQGTLAAMGQVVGTASAMCLGRGITPRGLYKNHITELQQTLLKHDQYIPDMKNDDPLDLVRKAKLTASSTARYEEFLMRHAQKGDAHPLNMSRAAMFPIGVRHKLESVSLLLASDNDEPTEVMLSLRTASASGDFSSTDDAATAKATVEPRREGWVKFKLDREIQTPYCWVLLPRTDGISWRLMETAPLGSCRAYGSNGNWTVVKGQYYALSALPPIATEVDCRVENITNGHTRIIGDASNMWASDPTQHMPQWVELSFASPTEVNTVYLTFDTDMNSKYHTTPLVPQCVRDYELSFHDGAKWTRLVAVSGNFQRRRVHRFDTVTASKLRLTAHATNGSRDARVFEIRAYGE